MTVSAFASTVASLTASSVGSLLLSFGFAGSSGSFSSALAASSRLLADRAPTRLMLNSCWLLDRASMVMPPLPASTPWSAAWIDASTMLLMSLKASESPIAMAAPVVPPKPAASAAAPATALMAEASSARRVALPARMPSAAVLAPSPSIVAAISVRILFSVYTPAPLTARPVVPPPPSPAAAATTMASIVLVERAVSVSAPLASTLESTIVARTCAACAPTLTCRHRLASRYCCDRKSKTWLPFWLGSLSLSAGPMYS